MDRPVCAVNLRDYVLVFMESGNIVKVTHDDKYILQMMVVTRLPVDRAEQ